MERLVFNSIKFIPFSKSFINFIVILLFVTNESQSTKGKNESQNSLEILNVILSNEARIEPKVSPNVGAISDPTITVISPKISAKEIPNESCERGVTLTDIRGSIQSPNYPKGYHNRTSCQWFIKALKADHIITISFDDLDIEVPIDSDKYCAQNPNEDICCYYSWIKIGSDSDPERKYCGRSEDNSLILKPFISSSNQTSIKFHTAIRVRGGRGFHLSYIIGAQKSTKCKSEEFHCVNRKCIPNKWRCNRRDECGDGSDELNCEDICLAANQIRCGSVSDLNGDSVGCYTFPTQRCDGVFNCENGADERGCGGCPPEMYVCRAGNSCYSEVKRCDGTIDCSDSTDELNCGTCGPNKTQCGTTGLTHCYDPFSQKCNRVLDCPNGEDEIGCFRGCHNKILCTSGSGCYSLEERCNGVPECNDYSDEKNCSFDLCKAERGSFLCGNGRCIRAVWTCDRSNDCSDGTDEMNCLKNSVITAAIMGSLICGLLLVIAISCTCKLIALRQVERHHSSSHTSPSHISHNYDRNFSINGFTGDSDTPLFRLEHGFFFREPPPSYATAVGGYHSDRNNSYIEQIRQIRRQRRLRRNRRRPPTPPPLEFADGDTEQNSSNSSTTAVIIPHSGVSTPTPSPTNMTETQNQTNNHKNNEQIKDEVGVVLRVGADQCQTTSNDSSHCQRLNPMLSSNSVNIELESIPSLSQSDCDSQPLIR